MQKEISSDPFSAVRPLDLLSLLLQGLVTKGISENHLYAPSSRFQKEEDDIDLPVEQE